MYKEKLDNIKINHTFVSDFIIMIIDLNNESN